MKAILVKEPGGVEQLYLGEAPTPVPGEGELLVRVHAAGVNRPDVLQRKGKYPPPPGASTILGLEVAGTVEELGPNSGEWRVGDAVCALLPGGGYAEYAVIPHEMAMPVPAGMPFVEAAAIPEVFLTAYQALYWLAGMKEGDHVLVHAGGSGVGTAAIQLVKAAGAHAHATASAGKLPYLQELGAETTIDYRTEDFAQRILSVTDGHGADVIVDFIGAPDFHSNLEALALDGRIVMLATLGGVKVEEVDLRRLFAKRATIAASTLRSRRRDYHVRLTRDFRRDILPLFNDGTIKPVIDRVYDWQDVADAHGRMEANENVGKIVLKVL
jgi:tumor protein p53-inducible protein 3